MSLYEAFPGNSPSWSATSRWIHFVLFSRSSPLSGPFLKHAVSGRFTALIVKGSNYALWQDDDGVFIEAKHVCYGLWLRAVKLQSGSAFGIELVNEVI
jgi:hypothetical protein